ncbi:hypothetical protein SprV_0200958000 [Sparganum proliferum]
MLLINVCALFLLDFFSNPIHSVVLHFLINLAPGSVEEFAPSIARKVAIRPNLCTIEEVSEEEERAEEVNWDDMYEEEDDEENGLDETALFPHPNTENNSTAQKPPLTDTNVHSERTSLQVERSGVSVAELTVWQPTCPDTAARRRQRRNWKDVSRLSQSNMLLDQKQPNRIARRLRRIWRRGGTLVHNLSSKELTKEQVQVLRHEASFNKADAKPVNMIAAVESVINQTEAAAEETKNLIRHQVSCHILTHKPREIRPKLERDAQRELKADKVIVIVPTDNGPSTVVLDRTEYLQKVIKPTEVFNLEWVRTDLLASRSKQAPYGWQRSRTEIIYEAGVDQFIQGR